MHLVTADCLTLNGLKGAGTDMQRHLFTLYTMSVDILQHAVREMQACSRGSHTSLDTCIDRLVGYLIIWFRASVKIWRNRQLPYSLKEFCEREVTSPREATDRIIKAFNLQIYVI